MAKSEIPIEICWEDVKAYMEKHDVVEIIRCRDCRYWEREKPFATSGRCFIWECTERKGSDYCSEAREVNP